jgi:predicted chitinase
MRAFEFLFELGDNPYPSPKRWSSDYDSGGYEPRSKRISIPNGILRIDVNQFDTNAIVNFYVNDKQMLSGEGDAFRILSTVMLQIKDYVRKVKPDYVVFGANIKEKGRIKLYDKVVPRLAAAMGYEDVTDDQDMWNDDVEADLDALDDTTGLKIYVLVSNKLMIDEDWKKTLGGIAAAGALALPGNLMHKPVNDQLPIASVEKADPAVVKQAAASLETAYGNALKKASSVIKNKAERAQFLAQCAHETQDFSTMKEFGGTLDFRKYDIKFNPRMANALGNDKPGDGARYHGRGFIQLTGKENYQRAGRELGLPLEKNPQLVERPDVAAKVALWYWQNRVKPKVNNFKDTKAVTAPINSSLRGLDDRHQKYLAYSELLGGEPSPGFEPGQGLKEHQMDNEHGWGETPNNRNVDYMGLRVMMRPSTFLKLALELKEPTSMNDIMSHIEQGGRIASPLLTIDTPAEWDEGDFSAPARVVGHEGRNRMKALQKLEGDQPQEVHIFPRGLRNRHMTPEFLENLNKWLIPEQQKQPIKGDFWDMFQPSELNSSIN